MNFVWLCSPVQLHWNIALLVVNEEQERLNFEFEVKFSCILQGNFSFDALFGSLVNELLPSYQACNGDAPDGAHDPLPNGILRISSDASKTAQGLSMPLFPEVDALLALFKDSCKELIDLRQQVFVEL